MRCDFDELDPVLRQVGGPSTAAAVATPDVQIAVPPNRLALPLLAQQSPLTGRLAEPLSVLPSVPAERMDPRNARPVSAFAAPPNRRALPSQDSASFPVGRLAEPLSIPPAVAAGRLDPFDARPATDITGPGVDELMSHCASPIPPPQLLTTS